jgi:tetratricopeptide (TPR) repeat protein
MIPTYFRKCAFFMVLLVVCLGAGPGCLQVNPKLADGIRQGDRSYRQGNLLGAERVLTQALAEDNSSPEAGEAYYLRGLVRLKLNKVREAQSDFVRAAEITQSDEVKANARACLGSIAFNKKQYQQAYVFYRQAADSLPQISPTDRVLYRLAVSAQRIGQWQTAQRTFSQIIRNYPDTASAKEAQKAIKYNYYTIVAGAFANASSATVRVNALNKAGLPARIEWNGTLNSVRVGRYNNYPLAERALQRVRQVVPEALIVP